MKVSIIIPTYNVRDVVESAISSVLNQSYPDIECLVIDGGSTDGTLGLLQKYGDRIKFVSEKDHGPFDALNKGVKMASGEIIGWLGADDFYSDNGVVARAVKLFQEKPIDICWSDLEYVSKDNPNKVVRYWRSSDFQKGAFARGWQLPHFTSFVRKKVFAEHGYFRDEFVISADYDLFIRFLEAGNIKSMYVHDVFLKAYLGGQSNRSFKNIFLGNQEIYRALKSNHVPFSFVRVFLLKPFRKLRQYL